MSEWKTGKVVVGSCKKITPKFKSMVVEEIYSRDERSIIENVKVKRNSKNDDIEIHLDMYSDGKEETLQYVADILIGSGKYVAEEINKK